MLKVLLQQLIRLKNPSFSFHKEITGYILLSLTFNKFRCLTRGLILQLLHFKKPTVLLLGKNTGFFNLPRIHFGSFVQIGDFSYLSGLGKEGLFIGNHSSIGAFSRVIISTTFDHPGSHIRIGKNVGIGEFAYLGGGGGLEIGDDCIIGQYFSCHPENHLYQNEYLPIRYNGVSRKGIKIGRNCWIGAKATILDGVHVGNNCVVAAGAVVTKNFPDNSIIGGVPARILKSTKEAVVNKTSIVLPENPALFK